MSIQIKMHPTFLSLPRHQDHILDVVINSGPKKKEEEEYFGIKYNRIQEVLN